MPTRSLITAIAAAAVCAVSASPALAGTDTISRIAGGPGSIAVPQPALQVGLQLPEGIAPTSDGGYLIADKHNNRVLKITAAGQAIMAAGGGSNTGENVPATQARVERPTDVAVTPDGGFLFVENARNRVRKVGPDGNVRTVAGNGQLTTDGDGGPATQAGLYYPWGVAVMPDGGFVVSQPYAYRVRRVMPDGSIRTILGNGVDSYPENVPGTQSGTKWPYGLAVMKDGSVLVAEDYGAKVRRVRPDGIVVRFAGSGTDMPSGISQGSENGKDATTVGIGRVCDIAVAPDNSVIIAQSDCAEPPYTDGSRYYVLGRVTPDGKYSLFGGNGYGPTYDVEGKHRLNTSFGRTRSLAFAGDGDLLFVENSYYRAYRIDTDIRPPAVAITPKFTILPKLPVAGQNTTFNASTSVAEQPATYAWDFDGNGTFEVDAGTNPKTVHKFPTHGTKSVTLKVTDARGNSATKSMSVAVNAPPVASFAVVPTKPIHGQAATLRATASDPDGTVVLYEWDVNPAVAGFEITSTTPTASYVFPTAGKVTVKLRVTDNKGTKVTKQKAVTVL